MEFFMRNLLIFVCFFPLLGVLLILLTPRGKEHDRTVKWIANLVAFIGFVISIPLITTFNDPQYLDASGMRFVVRASWIDAIGVQFFFGIDGISLLLILLTTLLGFISILSSWSAIAERVREYYCYFLILQVGMLGVFMALDFFLFYVFWEVMLVPMYFIIGVWAVPENYTQLSSSFCIPWLDRYFCCLGSWLSTFISTRSRGSGPLTCWVSRSWECPAICSIGFSWPFS